MIYQHKQLAAGRWNELTLIEQLANVGSEVERFLSWRAKNNADRARMAFERALELFDLTMQDKKNINRLKEVTRAREELVDFYLGTNEFETKESSLKNYYLQFAYVARRHL